MTVKFFVWNVAVMAIVALPQHGALQAQDYPTRRVTVIVPWPPGGTVDTVGRIIAPKLSDQLGEPVVIENRPGAGSTIGTAALAKAAPDGYTLGMPGSGSLAISPALYSSLPYEAAKDFAPIALVGRAPYLLIVNPSLPVTSIPDLAAYAKVNKLNYASCGGVGSPGHLYGEMFKTMTGIEMLHIPYYGSAAAVKDVAAGTVQLAFCDAAPALPLIRAGNVRALGVTTAARLPAAPEIPPLDEIGVSGFDVAGWFMVAGPVGVPAPVVEKIHDELNSIMASAEVADRVNKMGVVPVVSPPVSELNSFIVSEESRWGKVVQQTGLAGSR
jgi:tripartite-type tricarboxylate transporter receptor subunit TctC